MDPPLMDNFFLSSSKIGKGRVEIVRIRDIREEILLVTNYGDLMVFAQHLKNTVQPVMAHT